MQTEKPDPVPTDSERRAMVQIAAGANTPTQVGEALYGGKRTRQAYARPGGKLLRALERKGIAVEEVRRVAGRIHIIWRLTALGLRVARKLNMS